MSKSRCCSLRKNPRVAPGRVQASETVREAKPLSRCAALASFGLTAKPTRRQSLLCSIQPEARQGKQEPFFMSQLLINHFLNDLDRLRAVSGESREGIVSEAFKDWLKAWAKQHDLVFIPQYGFETPAKEKRYVDGALLHPLRVPFGYWEAKDEDDDLDKEIGKKSGKRLSAGQYNLRGFPHGGLDPEPAGNHPRAGRRHATAGATARTVLFIRATRDRAISQGGRAVQDRPARRPRCTAKKDRGVQTLITPPSAKPKRNSFYHAKETINPSVGPADVREMLIQHILTEEIFAKVFDDSEFHRENNIAKKLYALEEECFSAAVPRDRCSSNWSPITPLSVRRRRKSQVTRKSRPFSRSSTRNSTGYTIQRLLTGSACSIRPTKSCALWSRVRIGCAKNISARASSIKMSKFSTRRPARALSSANY